jgi:hypothetical protein
VAIGFSIGATIDVDAAQRTSASLLAVAKRNSGRRGRSRKRRPPAQPATGESSAPLVTAEQPLADGSSANARRKPARTRQRTPERRGGGISDATAMGERPHAPWHPLPLSELLILVGAIGAIVAWRRGPASNVSLLVAGVVAVVIGTAEFTLREHLGGYRSHTIILALLPVIAFHSIATLLVLAVTTVPRWLNLVLLPIDGALFAVLFKLLRARFRDARRERMFAAGR